MRLVAWNCQGGLKRKHVALVALNPDVAVVPESGPLDGLCDVLGVQPIRSAKWIPDDSRKGLAVVSYGPYSVQVHQDYDPEIRWVVPLTVDGPMPFTLLAVWTMPHAESGLYVHCLFEALSAYREILATPRVIWAGDFNNNLLLDKPHHQMKFAGFVDAISRLGFSSLYHLQSGLAHGDEADPTFFLHRKESRAHHIDFIFASQLVCELGFEITVGKHSEWAEVSDHMPLACSFIEPLGDAA